MNYMRTNQEVKKLLDFQRIKSGSHEKEKPTSKRGLSYEMSTVQSSKYQNGSTKNSTIQFPVHEKAISNYGNCDLDQLQSNRRHSGSVPKALNNKIHHKSLNYHKAVNHKLDPNFQNIKLLNSGSLSDKKKPKISPRLTQRDQAMEDQTMNQRYTSQPIGRISAKKHLKMDVINEINDTELESSKNEGKATLTEYSLSKRSNNPSSIINKLAKARKNSLDEVNQELLENNMFIEKEGKKFLFNGMSIKKFTNDCYTTKMRNNTKSGGNEDYDDYYKINPVVDSNMHDDLFEKPNRSLHLDDYIKKPNNSTISNHKKTNKSMQYISRVKNLPEVFLVSTPVKRTNNVNSSNKS